MPGPARALHARGGTAPNRLPSTEIAEDAASGLCHPQVELQVLRSAFGKVAADNAEALYFVARKDEVIKSCGEKVAPREVEITRMVGKSKLSQNKEERDRVNAAEELARRGQATIADAMRKA